MTKSGVILRPAVLDDADALTQYMAELMAEGLDVVTRRPPPTLAEEQAYIGRALSAERAFILLALHSGRVIGMLDLWAGSGPAFSHAASFGMSVAKDWRGRSVGRSLVEEAVRLARTWPGFCRLELEVAVRNQPGIRLYERQGFRTEGRKVMSVNLRGAPEDTLIMAKTCDD